MARMRSVLHRLKADRARPYHGPTVDAQLFRFDQALRIRFPIPFSLDGIPPIELRKDGGASRYFPTSAAVLNPLLLELTFTEPVEDGDVIFIPAYMTAIRTKGGGYLTPWENPVYGIVATCFLAVYDAVLHQIAMTFNNDVYADGLVPEDFEIAGIDDATVTDIIVVAGIAVVIQLDEASGEFQAGSKVAYQMSEPHLFTLVSGSPVGSFVHDLVPA